MLMQVTNWAYPNCRLMRKQMFGYLLPIHTLIKLIESTKSLKIAVFFTKLLEIKVSGGMYSLASKMLDRWLLKALSKIIFSSGSSIQPEINLKILNMKRNQKIKRKLAMLRKVARIYKQKKLHFSLNSHPIMRLEKKKIIMWVLS